MGYDAFGLPAENNAIKTGEHPRVATERSIESFREQFRALGHLDRLVARDLAPTSPSTTAGPSGSSCSCSSAASPTATEAPVQWCPKDADRARQRAGDRRPLRALRHRRSSRAASSSGSSASPTTPTACSPTSTCSSPGPSTSSRCSATGSAAPRAPRSIFRCEELELDFPVFTTRPDTLFGATFFVLAPEHPELERLVAGTDAEDAVREYVDEAARELDRGARRRGPREDRRPARPHRHQPGQRRADPDVRRRLRADGVRHRRDHGRARPRRARLRVRARRSACAIRRVVEPADGEAVPRRRGRSSATPSDERLVNSGDFDGMPAPEANDEDHRLARGARAAAGPRSTTACATGCVSRQRYWGCPIPIVYCERVRDRPGARRPAPGRAARRRGLRARRARARSPRPRTGSTTECPRCGGPARRETDTMDTFVDSSWYFLRYLDPRNDERAVATARSPTTGCPSTSTSAASSTRSCT